jgi:hypothetical protein
MIRRGLGLLLIGVLVACSPQPRSASYFEGHPEEAAQIVVECAAGKYRGEACVNAKAGAAEIRWKARVAAYKKNL